MWFSRILFATALTCLTSMSSAAQVEVKWRDFNDYKDVKRNEAYTQASYNRLIKKEFNTTFQQLAATLPRSQSLKIHIKELNLVGWIDPKFMPNRVRVINQQFPAAMTIKYELIEDEKTIKSGISDINNKGFYTEGNSSARIINFYYEKNMIKRWFKTTFE